MLLVEDEAKLAGLVSRGLREQGDLVDVTGTGAAALTAASRGDYDIILLDIRLPDIEGFDVCRRLRSQGVQAPILMLTARIAVSDRIEGLDSGADDYLGKPFAFAELLARMRALSRRGPIARAGVLVVGALRLDPATRRVWRGEAEIDLSAREFALLEVFMRCPEQVLARQHLLERVWESSAESSSNVVDVYVRYLREEIDRPFGTTSLETVRGAGYRLTGSTDG